MVCRRLTSIAESKTLGLRGYWCISQSIEIDCLSQADYLCRHRRLSCMALVSCWTLCHRHGSQWYRTDRVFHTLDCPTLNRIRWMWWKMVFGWFLPCVQYKTQISSPGCEITDQQRRDRIPGENIQKHRAAVFYSGFMGSKSGSPSAHFRSSQSWKQSLSGSLSK